MNEKLTLVSHHLCPYVQRAAIALTEKAVAFERVYVDLSAKPDWFKAVSPLGKVPLLLVGEEVLFESAVILEYLEETRGAPMHPADPLLRARHRGWIEFGSAILNDIWRFYTAPDEDSLKARAADLRRRFDWLDRHLSDGPYFAGAPFHLVDTVYGPIFRYFDAFDQIGDFGILDGMPRVAAYRMALADRPSVAKAVAPEYPQLLRNFLLARNTAISERMAEPAV